jgi:hypothetical protein
MLPIIVVVEISLQLHQASSIAFGSSLEVWACCFMLRSTSAISSWNVIETQSADFSRIRCVSLEIWACFYHARIDIRYQQLNLKSERCKGSNKLWVCLLLYFIHAEGDNTNRWPDTFMCMTVVTRFWWWWWWWWWLYLSVSWRHCFRNYSCHVLITFLWISCLKNWGWWCSCSNSYTKSEVKSIAVKIWVSPIPLCCA